ncbi:MAG: translation initiation factor IF-2 subunit alpha [Candidatus Aenigmarchaeota archaeon]|nr:translation initiation factor IF-2 subunit alpha [Candidatus Aenigmarchaeota archaeon]
MRKRGLPERGEMVVCEITKINPNSVYAKLLEYDRSGMIHVSEIAKRWVKDIREFVKLRQLVVCSVGRADENDISLSLKRVNKNQGDRKLQEYKKEMNAEKFLEQIAKQLGKTLEEAFEEVGYDLEEKFGSVNKSFETALRNPNLLAEKGINKEWADAITEMAKKNYVEKTYEVKSKLNLVSYAENGMEVIKGALMKAAENGLDVRYISAPKYQITGTGKNIKEVKELVENVSREVVGKVEKSGGECSFVLEGKN